MKPSTIEKAYASARRQYEDLGVDVSAALETLKSVVLSLPCWQGDDIRGFERPNEALSSGGIQVTGGYPGRARNIEELRQDLSKAFSLIPGSHRLNLHAIYGEFGSKPVERNAIEPAHFRSWVTWAQEKGFKLDFNATCFSHPKAGSGFTLSSKDKNIRAYWIGHVRSCRKISAFFGRELKSPSLHNLWIPDGSKDAVFDRWSHRSLLKDSLDEIFRDEYSPAAMKDSLESKLFGIGSESYVVGSHEFYLGYALAKRKLVCLDLGHFHPTESIADKLSALLQFFGELALHLSRPVRWDSDHVITLSEELKSVAEEIIRGEALRRVYLALDFFDASMNRVGAWVIAARATLRAVLQALLQPAARLKDFEDSGNFFNRLALQEEVKSFPFGAIWDYYCLSRDVPPAAEWLKDIEHYEKTVLCRRESRRK